MAPVLQPGDRILSLPRPAAVGRIVIATDPAGRRVVKRVAAVGPATVSIADGRVSVDGHPEDPDPVEDTPGAGRWRVDPGHAFLLSDARHRTTADSRTWGAVPLDSISGTVVLRYRPLRRLGRL